MLGGAALGDLASAVDRMLDALTPALDIELWPHVIWVLQDAVEQTQRHDDFDRRAMSEALRDARARIRALRALRAIERAAFDEFEEARRDATAAFREWDQLTR